MGLYVCLFRSTTGIVNHPLTIAGPYNSQDGTQVVEDLGWAVLEPVVRVQVVLVQLAQDLTHRLDTPIAHSRVSFLSASPPTSVNNISISLSGMHYVKECGPFLTHRLTWKSENSPPAPSTV